MISSLAESLLLNFILERLKLQERFKILKAYEDSKRNGATFRTYKDHYGEVNSLTFEWFLKARHLKLLCLIYQFHGVSIKKHKTI